MAAGCRTLSLRCHTVAAIAAYWIDHSCRARDRRAPVLSRAQKLNSRAGPGFHLMSTRCFKAFRAKPKVT